MIREYRAELPLPPSLNRTYKAGRGRFYMAPEATAWKQTAGLLLLAAGWRPSRAHIAWFTVEFVMHCSARRDLDSSSKIIIDTLSDALHIDDRICMRLIADKDVVKRRADYRLSVKVTTMTEAMA